MVSDVISDPYAVSQKGASILAVVALVFCGVIVGLTADRYWSFSHATTCPVVHGFSIGSKPPYRCGGHTTASTVVFGSQSPFPSSTTTTIAPAGSSPIAVDPIRGWGL